MQALEIGSNRLTDTHARAIITFVKVAGDEVIHMRQSGGHRVPPRHDLHPPPGTRTIRLAGPAIKGPMIIHKALYLHGCKPRRCPHHGRRVHTNIRIHLQHIFSHTVSSWNRLPLRRAPPSTYD